MICLCIVLKYFHCEVTIQSDKNPLVSVVIPTYNHAHYLGMALQSVIDQTYRNLEVIVVDNHSTDETDMVMVGFDDHRIKHLKVHNGGVIAKSRNAGVDAASGEWIAFLDSDDWWDLDKVEVSLACRDKNCDIIYHDLRVVKNRTHSVVKGVMRSRQLKRNITTNLLVKGNALYTSSVMVRRELYQSVGGMCEDPELVAAEDYNTWLRISCVTGGSCYISKPLGYYHVNNLSASRIKNMYEPVSYAVKDFWHYLPPHFQPYLWFRLLYINLRSSVFLFCSKFSF